MSKDKLIDSLGRIDDDMILGVEALRRKRKSDRWKKWAGLAACFCLILGAMAATPGLFEGTMPLPTEQNDFPVRDNTDPTVETVHTEPALLWTVHYNDAVSLVAADRAFIRGIFTEELNEEELTALKPDRWYDGMACSGCGIFDNYGNLLDVTLTVNTQCPVTVIITDYAFGGCYLLDGEAAVSVCADTEYRLYQYAYGDQVTLGADAVIGDLYFDFCLETTPEELEQAKLDFQSVLECFAFYSEGKPDLSAIIPDELPELTEQIFQTLSEARLEPDFGRYLPGELPTGFAESDIRRFRFGDSNYLSALWSRGLDDLSWVITPYTEVDAGRLTGVEDLENYDLSLYPIPRAESVPEELREIVDDPIFEAEELTLEAVRRRAYKVHDAGDTDGWRMRFSVRYGDVLISVSSKGVEPEWLYEQLKNLMAQ